MTATKQNGFTLVELILVIIILGALAVVAAPRFIDVSSDANLASIKGMKSVLDSASDLVYARSEIRGVAQDVSANIDIDSDGTNDVMVVFGYPTDDLNTGITQAMGLDFEEQWAWAILTSPQRLALTTANLSQTGAGAQTDNTNITNSNCYLTYQAPNSAGNQPNIELITTGC